MTTILSNAKYGDIIVFSHNSDFYFNTQGKSILVNDFGLNNNTVSDFPEGNRYFSFIAIKGAKTPIYEKNAANKEIVSEKYFKIPISYNILQYQLKRQITTSLSEIKPKENFITLEIKSAPGNSTQHAKQYIWEGTTSKYSKTNQWAGVNISKIKYNNGTYTYDSSISTGVMWQC